MTAIEWDKTGERLIETGISKGVHYTQDDEGDYKNGVAWNGLTGLTESPSGADTTDLYADDIKYASLQAAETFGCTIEAYTYPDEFAACDGSAEIADGVMIGQQDRKTFGLAYTTQIKTDTSKSGYKIHLIYGCKASPSERGYTTINDSPDAISFSWEITTTPVNVKGAKPTALLTVNSLKVDADKLKALEDVLYGTATDEPRLPLPDEVVEIIGGTAVETQSTIEG